MTMTPHTLGVESPADELALLEVGDYGAGKSWLAATMPGTNFFLDSDQRLGGLRLHPNAKNCYGLSFGDNPNPNMVPTGFTDLQETLVRLEKSPLLKDVHASFANAGDKWIDTLIYDSVQTIADMARKYILYHARDTDGISKNFSVGGMIIRVPRTFTAWGGEMEMVTGAILQGRALLHCKTCTKSVTYVKDPATQLPKLFHTAAPALDKDHAPVPKAMNVIAILHECMEEDERSTDENPIYTGKIAVYPARYKVLLKYFNEVWRVERISGRIPKVSIDPDGKFTKAKTALGISKVDAPNLAQVLSDSKMLKKL